MSAALHITPGPQPTITAWHECPMCKQATPFVGYTQDWYDTVWTCCRCGDSWSDGYRLERPFGRGWRNEALLHTRQAWWRVIAERSET